jgi:cytidine deaminase
MTVPYRLPAGTESGIARAMFRSFMPLALAEARAAAHRGEVPVGAVVTAGREVLARAGNRCREQGDPTAHAEILAIRAACAARASERLSGATLWVTLEPCAMCAGAIAAARLDRLVFGASDPKSGGVLGGARVFAHPQAHHAPEVVEGIDAEACAALLQGFFAERRGAAG